MHTQHSSEQYRDFHPTNARALGRSHLPVTSEGFAALQSNMLKRKKKLLSRKFLGYYWVLVDIAWQV
jgi:hypothetical protein